MVGCQGLTLKGAACRLRPLKGSNWCKKHNEQTFTPLTVKKQKITELTEFYAPTKTFALKHEWVCQSVPCAIISKSSDTVKLKPFNKVGEMLVDFKLFTELFTKLKRDSTHVYTDSYPTGKIACSEFLVKPISIQNLRFKFRGNASFVTLLNKAYQDAYSGKGNNSCITVKEYTKFNGNHSKLTRVGDPVFNRTPRHTVPIPKTMTRENFEKCSSFPAPIGVRAEDFALPSQQNAILRELLTQIFNCVNSPECPEELQKELGIVVVRNSHKCDWCGEKIDITELNQEYCSTEHSVNFCHRDPNIGTQSGNVYIGHCSCNREQGGYSEQQRVEQVIRLAKNNPKFREMILLALS